jgi:glycosyltransferase involved in cell wall biosynthesis
MFKRDIVSVIIKLLSFIFWMLHSTAVVVKTEYISLQMYKNLKISVVVPAYNEEKQIMKVIKSMPDYVDAIVIIDDCSKDKTSSVVEKSQKKYPKVVLLKHQVNEGVGGAIATGYKWARDNDFDAAVVMAGDAQMDPLELPVLIDPIAADQTDYAKANRLIYKEFRDIIPKARLFGNAILSFLTKIASGYWHVSDSQTGYTVVNKKVLHTINWDKMYKRYGQPNDLLVKLNVHNFRVKDIPTKPVYNVGEESKLRIKKVLLPMSMLLLRLFFWRLKEKYIIRDFHPLILFYALGLLFGGLSVLFFIRLIYKWIAYGHVPEVTLLLLLFSFATSVQSIFFAMFFDQENNKNLR